MPMKLLAKKLHTYYYIFCVLLLYLLFYPFLYYCSRKAVRYATLNKLRRVWGKSSSAISGIFYRFSYEVPIDWKKTYVICPNHTSNLDITWASLLTKNNFSFLGKEELMHQLTTRLFFRSIDIPVKRESNISAFKAFKRASEYLKNGVSMVIFPEGKISDDY